MARKRDYKAEYARRIRNAEAAGKSRAAARGHARERAERAERNLRYREQYGASTGTLRTWRNRAADRVVELIPRYWNARRRFWSTTQKSAVLGNIKYLRINDLKMLASIDDADDIRALARLGYDEIDYPDAVDDEINPYWYH